MKEIRTGEEIRQNYEFFVSENGEYDFEFVPTPVHMIEYIPSYDNERVIAHTEAGIVTGGLLVVKELPPEVVEAVEQDGEAAAEDIVARVGELGLHKVILGVAYLGMIDGIKPNVLHKLTTSQFTETLPEN